MTTSDIKLMHAVVSLYYCCRISAPQDLQNLKTWLPLASEIWYSQFSLFVSGASRHRHQLQGYVDSELLHQRHLWEDCQWDIFLGSLHKEAHSNIQRNPDSSQACPAWRVGQACRLWGNQGCHKVHFLSEFYHTKQHLVILITTILKHILLIFFSSHPTGTYH